MPLKFIKCVKEVKKKIKQGKIPKTYNCGKKSCLSNPYSICRESVNFHGTTHDIGLIHKRKK